MKNNENREEIDIFVIIDLYRRNLPFILWSIIASLIIVTFFSFFIFFLNKDVEKYSLTTSIFISGEEILEETVIIINNSFAHSRMITQILTNLNIETSSYELRSEISDNDGILKLIVEGPEVDKLTEISSKVFNTVKPLVETAFPTIKIEKLEISSPVAVPQSTKVSVKWFINFVLGIVLGVVLSIFYIFAAFFLSPNIVQDNELESLFGAKILGRFVGRQKNQTLIKFFEVR